MAELGRLVKAGAVNLTADAAAGAPFKLDAAALAAQPCRPQARRAPSTLCPHAPQCTAPACAPCLSSLSEHWDGTWRRSDAADLILCDGIPCSIVHLRLAGPATHPNTCTGVRAHLVTATLS